MLNQGTNNEDTLVGIFDTLYLCRIPVIATRTMEQIKQFGMYSTGDKNLDKVRSRDMTTTWLSIAKMAEHHGNGSAIALVNYMDVKTIYEVVTKHLTLWRNKVDDAVNNGGVPFADLITLDQFAVDVYEHAKYMFDKETQDSLNMRYLNGIMSLNRNTFFSTAVPTANVAVNGVPVTEVVLPTFPERDSFTAFFKSRMPRGVNSWK